MTLSWQLYPEGELAAPPPVQPLHKPTPITQADFRAHDNDDEIYAHCAPNKCSLSDASPSRKRESYNMSGSTYLVTSSGVTLSLPIPSDSQSDPLNWGCWKTAGAIAAIAWYSVMASTAVQAASQILPEMAREFGDEEVKPWTMESIVTAPTLFMGVGALLWLPLSLGLGRRPVFLIVALMMLLATLGAGLARNFHELLACVCIIGLGDGFSLTSAFLMVIDMTFIHQRPKAVALLWSLLGFAGTGFLALVPYLSRGSWRRFYCYWSIPMGLSLVFAFALCPETYYKRPTVAFDGLILLQSATEKLTVYKDAEADSDIYRDLPDLPSGQDSQRTGFRKALDILRLSPSPQASWQSVGYCYFQMVFCAINPLIFWVILTSAIHWTGILFIGATYKNILQSPPYNLRSSLIININTSSAVGGLLAYPIGGWLIDRILTRLASRNRGVREAEHYLIGYIPPAIIGALSTIVYGLAVHNSLHFGFYYLSCGLEAFSWITLSITNTMWLTEAFPRWAAPAVAVSGGACYIISFSLSFALVPWIAAHGFKLVGIELAVFQVVAGLIAVPIAFWGKSARQAISGKWSGERAGALRPL